MILQRFDIFAASGRFVEAAARGDFRELQEPCSTRLAETLESEIMAQYDANVNVI
jgi:hypothetical protein